MSETRELWKEWTSGPFGEFGSFMALELFLSREVARRLGTTTGADNDVRWHGRLISIREYVPSISAYPSEPSDEQIAEAVRQAADRACREIRAISC